MYHIAICDDEHNICAELEAYVEKYFREHFLKGSIEVFSDGASLCRYLQSSQAVDLLFLDIDLPKTNGVEAGKYIREELKNELLEIVYISSKTNYAMELFQCRPLDFLVKPLTCEMVAHTMDVVMRRNLVHHKKLTLQTGKEKRVFFQKDILYFRSEDKAVCVETVSGETCRVKAKLDDIEAQISEDLFLRTHKSFLVNHIHVKNYGTDYVTMTNGDRISISKAYRASMKLKLMEIELS